MIVGCYTLDLYCDFEHGEGEMPRQFTGRTYSACIRAARKMGWVVRAARAADDRCVCRKHRGQRTTKGGTP